MSQEEIFAAFANPDTSRLLALICANPSFSTLESIIKSFLPYLRLRNPTHALQIAEHLSSIGNADKLWAIWNLSSDDFLRSVYEMLKRQADEKMDVNVHPQNDYLLRAMMYGACASSGLCKSVAYMACGITRGLQLPAGENFRDFFPESEDEVRALHAIIQVLAWGLECGLPPGTPFEIEEILPGLLEIEKKGVIKHPGGRALLQLAIREAKGGFDNETSYEDIWTTLFPPPPLGGDHLRDDVGV
ncbi:hypothetical protein CC1G_11120 [Coprinopsis cinerea okayama7|uniref:Uncharacterized protein n=1 Tax=Coprinopsis cinerea (strain Okayama-7 / 130 / ATCC MYA-4618 / FGSC 9003) TaxID=240176 RepID=A8N4Q5_COPC7|nr:hypothetical protein CC1G_11120 [Coprinopsis cinerea okayama7\|eukprot:XP_001829850.1 hypothetical protein CC1G_11120 [Coprinopsis cinerea okayama7\